MDWFNHIERRPIKIVIFGWFGTFMDELAGMQQALVKVCGAQRIDVDLEGMALAWRKLLWRAMHKRYEPWSKVGLVRVGHVCKTHGIRWTGWTKRDLIDSVRRWPLYEDASLVALLPRKLDTAIMTQLDGATLGPCMPTISCRFDRFLTTDLARAYKPSQRFYDLLPTQLEVEERNEILVVSNDRIADLDPAAKLGYQVLEIDHDEDEDELPTLGQAMKFLSR